MHHCNQFAKRLRPGDGVSFGQIYAFVFRTSLSRKERKLFSDCFICRVTDCPGVFNTSEQRLNVYSKHRDFNSTGAFSCSVGEELFYKNGSARLSNSTSCSAYATWNDQNNIKCGKGLYEK